MTDEDYAAIMAEVKNGVEQIVKTAIKSLEDNKYSTAEVLRTVQLGSNLGMSVYYAVTELDTKEERNGLVDFIHRADFKV